MSNGGRQAEDRIKAKDTEIGQVGHSLVQKFLEFSQKVSSLQVTCCPQVTNMDTSIHTLMHTNTHAKCMGKTITGVLHCSGGMLPSHTSFLSIQQTNTYTKKIQAHSKIG